MAETTQVRNWRKLAAIGIGCILVASALVGLGSFIGSKVGAADDPDITGVWNRYPPYPDTFSTEPEPEELQVVEPPLKEPYLTEWRNMRQRRQDADAAGRPLPTPSSLCQPEGMPSIMGAHYAMEFLQTPGQVTVLAEFLTQTRRIYLNQPLPNPDDIEPTYNGYAVGKWEGDTLVVTTYGVKEDVRYEDIPHSAKMKIVERWHLIAPDILQNDITIEDPQYLARPYSFNFKYKREKPDYKIAEFVCENEKNIIEKDGSLGVKTE
ncbi:hypothetical protein [Sphingobium cloacae]|uniref:Uncharacterized protein n=1 Tax=Sphingobium cloacae TaxID=120107 RepID=A0A1E1F1W3_9SPHN|nr:hypothetical protein [Sphingobium cloacae]BAV64452.1 hypothetical protein SCLO_1014120 [Sphingobium cloacae]